MEETEKLLPVTETVQPKRKRSRQLLGIGCILLVVFLWVSSSQVIQYTFKNMDFNKPFFMTYFSVTLFSLYLFGFLFKSNWKYEPKFFSKVLVELKNVFTFKDWYLVPNEDKAKFSINQEQDRSIITDSDELFENNDKPESDASDQENTNKKKNKKKKNYKTKEIKETKEKKSLEESEEKKSQITGGNNDEEEKETQEEEEEEEEDDDDDDGEEKERKDGETKEEEDELDLEDQKEGKELQKPNELAPISKVFKVAFIISILWFLANYTFNISLSMTSVSSSTIISSTSGFFTMILSFFWKNEKLNFVKVLSVFIAFGGVLMVGLSDRKGSGKHEFFGDIISLFSSMVYGVYISLLKKLIPDEKLLSVPMLFGFIGATSFIVFTIFFWILHVTGIEKFEIPSGKEFAVVLLNGLIGSVLSDIFWCFSVFLTSPIIATIGISLTIPLGMISDMIIKNSSFSQVYIYGAVLVIVGFLLTNLSEKIHKFLKKCF
ncbi:solute carrier family 35 member f5 [Anaeramoeba flamelloides]|uniref:Solute carrier family 35 member f5 n=1 Tax=Anaeramoeba flamelloides TaxID=1746091 RepID=A0AAV7ZU87_9EUKA|nr:solute carrier family 35 member f5 [Anaeramoeba flamelloides]